MAFYNTTRFTMEKFKHYALERHPCDCSIRRKLWNFFHNAIFFIMLT